MRKINRLVFVPLNKHSFHSASNGSEVYHELKIGPMKRLYKYYTKDTVNLAGGVPMERCFPFQSINVQTCDLTSPKGSYELTKGKDLYLNYLRGDGINELKEWINNHMKKLHPAKVDYGTCMTVGSTDALAKTLMLLNGDSVLMDQYAYGTAINACKVMNRTPIGIKMDSEGMIPSSLDESIIAARKKGYKPDCIYVTPVGQNPTGLTMSLKRKQDIYNVCKTNDILIIEDDAYYYLYYGDKDASKIPGLNHLPASFLSIDTDNRVIRFDSLSKFVSPGVRLGWISGHHDFIAKFLLLQEMTTQFPSSISQSMFMGLLNHWQDTGLDTHLQNIQNHYLNQKNLMCHALNSVKNSAVTYVEPSGGMFLWLKLMNNLAMNTNNRLFQHLAGHGVITVPGEDFYVDSIENISSKKDSKNNKNIKNDEVKSNPAIVRLTFAAANKDNILEGINRLIKGIQTFK